MNLPILRLLCLAIAISTLSTACYRMPTDDDFSLVPSTNNPDVTRQRGESAMPQVAY